RWARLAQVDNQFGQFAARSCRSPERLVTLPSRIPQPSMVSSLKCTYLLVSLGTLMSSVMPCESPNTDTFGIRPGDGGPAGPVDGLPDGPGEPLGPVDGVAGALDGSNWPSDRSGPGPTGASLPGFASINCATTTVNTTTPAAIADETFNVPSAC